MSGILRDLAAFGCTVDEGSYPKPRKRANTVPTVSQTAGKFIIFCETLVEKGFAYPCFCSAETLDEVRKQQEAEKRPRDITANMPAAEAFA